MLPSLREYVASDDASHVHLENTSHAIMYAMYIVCFDPTRSLYQDFGSIRVSNISGWKDAKHHVHLQF